MLGGCVSWASAAVSDKGASASTGPSEPLQAAVVSPNDYSGSDIERINSAIAAAAGTGRRVVIPRSNTGGTFPRDVWLIDSAVLVQSEVTLVLDNCRIKLSDRCRDNLIRSANCGMGITNIPPMRNIHIRGVGTAVLEGADRPRSTGDSAKTLGVNTYGTDAGRAGENQKGDWRNIGVLLASVEDFSIEGIALKDTHCWAISLERCARGTLKDLDFDSSGFKTIDGVRQTTLNQDGIDLRQGCHHVLIENITGFTGDDLIALTGIPHAGRTAGGITSTMVSSTADRGQGQDDIHHVTLRNIRGYSRGGHHIVRLLNTSGLGMHDVTLDGLLDTSPATVQCKAAVKIGDNNPRWGGVTPLGDTRQITIHKVVSKAAHTILIAGSLADSTISEVERVGTAGEAVTCASGPGHVRNVTITNVRAAKVKKQD